jgi:hypothetical protein
VVIDFRIRPLEQRRLMRQQAVSILKLFTAPQRLHQSRPGEIVLGDRFRYGARESMAFYRATP